VSLKKNKQVILNCTKGIKKNVNSISLSYKYSPCVDVEMLLDKFPFEKLNENNLEK
jgi:hypothetical protein